VFDRKGTPNQETAAQRDAGRMRFVTEVVLPVSKTLPGGRTFSKESSGKAPLFPASGKSACTSSEKEHPLLAVRECSSRETERQKGRRGHTFWGLMLGGGENFLGGVGRRENSGKVHAKSEIQHVAERGCSLGGSGLLSLRSVGV